jgi:hypothetical protein
MPVVRKISANRNYNGRLKAQIERQVEMAALLDCPRVIRTGYSLDELFYADMEYIQGLDFVSFASIFPISTVVSSLNPALDFLIRMKRLSSSCIDEVTFREKIRQIEQRCMENPLIVARSELPLIFSFLNKGDWKDIPQSLSHGDFTLENMVFGNPRTCTFIDFGDGPLSSLWLDAAKLLQDCRSGWTIRSATSQAPSVRDSLVLTTRLLFNHLTAFIDDQFCDLSPRMAQLKVLQFARVLPYVQERSHAELIFEGINECMAER